MTVTPLAAQELVQLKALLDQAVTAAKSGAAVQRLTAVVLLDAVNERVMHVVATPLGAVIPERATFDQAAEKIAGPLGNTWNRAGWQDVRRLHRVRNLAQHEGLAADRDLLPAWTAATVLFTRTLVELVYGVNLDEVTVADAVRDPEIAGSLRSAETALAVEDAPTAVRAAGEAFFGARRKWLSRRPGREPFAFHRIGGSTSFNDPLRGVADALKEIVESDAVSAFATDPAEHLWFRSIIADRMTPPTEAEAQRAVAFAFWWIVRWEAFSATYPVDRRQAQQQALRRTRRSPEDVARVEGVQVRLYDGGPGRAKFGLVDVPPDELFDDWARAVAARLADVTGAAHPHVESSGTLTVTVTAEADYVALALSVAAAVALAEEDVRVSQAAAAQQRAAHKRLDEEYRGRLREHQLPEWVVDVGLSLSRSAGPDLVRALTLRIAPDFAPAELHTFLREHDATEAYYGAINGDHLLTPVLGPERLASLLWEADAAVRPVVEERVNAVEQRQRAERTARDAIVEALRRG